MPTTSDAVSSAVNHQVGVLKILFRKRSAADQARTLQRALEPMVPSKMLRRFRNAVDLSLGYIEGPFKKLAIPEEYQWNVVVVNPDWVWHIGYESLGRIALLRGKGFHPDTRCVRLINGRVRELMGKRGYRLYNEILSHRAEDLYVTPADAEIAEEKKGLHERLEWRDEVTKAIGTITAQQPGAFMVIPSNLEMPIPVADKDEKVGMPKRFISKLPPRAFPWPLYLGTSFLYNQVVTNGTLYQIETPKDDFDFELTCLGDVLMENGSKLDHMATKLHWHSQALRLRALRQYPLDLIKHAPMTTAIGFIPPKA